MIVSCTQLPLELSSFLILMLMLVLMLVLISQLFDLQLHTIASGAFVLPALQVIDLSHNAMVEVRS